MESPVSPKDEIWFLRFCHHVSTGLYQLFPEMEEMLIEKVRQWTFLYDTKLPDDRDQHMRVIAWEETEKAVKIKRKFYIL